MWAESQAWDLKTGTYESASADLVTWSSANVTFTAAKNGGTNVNNYLGGSGSNSHTRLYNKNLLTFTPLNGASVSSIEITLTASSYATYITGGTLTNCTAAASDAVVTITPTTGTSACSVQLTNTIRVNTVTVTYTGGSDSTPATVSFTEAPNAFISVGDNYTNVVSSTPAELTITYASSNNDIATINSTTGEATGVAEGVVTITASWLEQTVAGTKYSAGTKTYNLYVGKVIEDGVFDFTGYQNYGSGVALNTSTSTYQGKDAYVFTAGNISITTGGDNAKYFAWFDVDPDPNELRFYSGTNFTVAAPTGYVITKIAFTGKSNVEKMTVDSGTLTGNNTASTWTGCSQTVKFTRGGGNPGYYTITVTYSDVVPATISTAKYATFVSPYATDFSTTGITVYTATAGETSVTLNEVASGKVPANTPVVLYKAGADGTAINVPVIASADAVGSNDLKVSVGGEPTNAYVLANKDSGVGFYKWAGGSLTSGKIYLQGASSAREFLGFGDVTGIENLTPALSQGEGAWFDLQGRRVAQPTKGLYIVNGKKVVIK